MSNKLYVANLAYSISEDALRAAFEVYGTVTDVHIATDRETGRPRGFAFVTFDTTESAQSAMAKLNGTELEGRALTVNEARPKEGGASSGGGGGGAPNRNFGPDRKAGAFQQRYRNRR